MLQIEVDKVCVPGSSDRLNEDALFFWEDGHRILAAAIDGATSRLISTAQQPLFEDKALTGAAFAAQVTRDALERTQTESLSPAERLLVANAALADVLASVYGTVTPEAIAAREPEFTYDDLRYVRLILPACVVTLIDLDLDSGQLTYAHAGDTALFWFGANGDVRRITPDPMGQHGDVLFSRLREIAQARQITIREAIRDPEIVKMNLEGGLYHNYVDAAGNVDPQLGVGVIDGLPELAAYIKTGTVTLAPGDRILVCSDGFVWPQPWDEDKAATVARYQKMGELLQQGVSTYLTTLRQVEDADKPFLQYPRFKQHDDATGIMIKCRA